MSSVQYRLACIVWMQQLRSAIRKMLQALTWPSHVSPLPAPQETAQLSALPAEPLPAPAATEDPLAEAVAHLEFLGYEVELHPDGWSFARHPYRFNFHLRTFAQGINLHCLFGIGASIDNSRAGWLDFLNTANERGSVTRFSLVENINDLCAVRMRARVTGAYSRAMFSLVMDMWHDDLDLVRRKPEFPVESSADERAADGAVTVN